MTEPVIRFGLLCFRKKNNNFMLLEKKRSVRCKTFRWFAVTKSWTVEFHSLNLISELTRDSSNIFETNSRQQQQQSWVAFLQKNYSFRMPNTIENDEEYNESFMIVAIEQNNKNKSKNRPIVFMSLSILVHKV